VNVKKFSLVILRTKREDVRHENSMNLKREEENGKQDKLE